MHFVGHISDSAGESSISIWTWKDNNDHRLLVINKNHECLNVKIQMGTDTYYSTAEGQANNHSVYGSLFSPWYDEKMQ